MTKSYIYVIGQVCYASSHDNVIGIYDNKELADFECTRLNEEYRNISEDCKETAEAWGDPYYVFEEDITEFEKYKCSDHPGFQKWIAVYGVPSLGEFTFFPEECTAVETFNINETKN